MTTSPTNKPMGLRRRYFSAATASGEASVRGKVRLWLDLRQFAQERGIVTRAGRWTSSRSNGTSARAAQRQHQRLVGPVEPVNVFQQQQQGGRAPYDEAGRRSGWPTPAAQAWVKKPPWSDCREWAAEQVAQQGRRTSHAGSISSSRARSRSIWLSIAPLRSAGSPRRSASGFAQRSVWLLAGALTRHRAR